MDRFDWFSDEECEAMAEISRSHQETAAHYAAWYEDILRRTCAAQFTHLKGDIVERLPVPESRIPDLCFSRNGLLALYGWEIYVQSTGECLAELPDEGDVLPSFVRAIEGLVHWPGFTGPVPPDLREAVAACVRQSVQDQLEGSRGTVARLEQWLAQK
jgi:hypothetical protein